MDYAKIITTSFCGKSLTADHRWTAEIWRRGATPDAVLEVDADEVQSAVVEWAEDDLWAPIHGSTCTLQLLSPGDRSLVDLYTVPPAEVQLRLYRNGGLWWVGTLDPEFYEEPYDNRVKDYTVTLTFSDFGILDRMDVDWGTAGRKTLRSIISDCASRAGLDLLTLISEVSSTYVDGLTTGDHKLLPQYVAARCANFYDEDGKPTTLKEALAAVLQPLGWRIEQRCGNIRLYDLNKRATPYTPQDLKPVQIYADGTLSAGKTARRIELTFSPYDEDELYNGKIDPDTLFGTDDTTSVVNYNLDYNWDDPVPGFTLHTGIPSDVSALPYALSTVAAKAKYFRIEPKHSGSECAGVAYSWPTVSSAEGGFTYGKGGEAPFTFRPEQCATLGDAQMRLFKCKGIPVPASGGGGYRRLKLTLDLCVDCRYNPYESADEYNEEGANKRCSEEINLLYVPARVYLLNASGTITHYYESAETLSPTGYLQDNGRWVAAASAPWGKMFLAYYGADLEKKTSGVQCGWATNRPYVPTSAMPKFRAYKGKSFKARGDGECIPLPPAEGTLVFEIGRGICFYNFDHTDVTNAAGRVAEINWILYKDPTVGVVNKDYTDIDPEDEVFTGEVESEAADDITIDTTCGGTDAKGERLTARGVLMTQNQNTKAWHQLTTITRGPNAGRPEALLLATIASQLTPRHTVISGTCDLDIGAFTLCRVQGQPADRLFIPASEVADLREMEAKVKLIEISPDEYRPEYTA
jgi:hypothetical protein